ncbi:hypothetical protein D9758_007490 [Tetrapyrgos nigripes]|uniref:F-box domain-containing protein n=1 Tax=Tetrapyrgos nigripes TaxID=182062 RepID=A0A8H5G3F3_9AGAR|nr:hypothetical protein D9758_007490 [Tetrapyrgos nigripes]
MGSSVSVPRDLGKTNSRTYRNSLALINQLPPEILSQIFLFCASSTSFSTPLRPSRWSFIAVSHVCQYWRNVALGCPALWSYIDSSNPDCILEMLKRSGTCPLTFRISVGKVQAHHMKWIQEGRATAVALGHIYRVREFTLYASPIGTVISHTGNLGLAQAVPLLEVLRLEAVVDNRFVHDPVKLSSRFLDGDAPRLKHLELRNFLLPWDSRLLKGLTVLKLSLNDPRDAPTSHQVRTVLARMPGLKVLELDGLGVLPPPATTSNIKVVQLSHLRSVTLRGSSARCANLLSHISFPVTTNMQFNIVVDPRTDPDVSLMLTSLSRIRSLLFSENEPQSRISRLQISVDYSPQIHAGVQLPQTSITISLPPWLTLSIQFIAVRVAGYNQAELIANVLEALSPLISIHNLSLSIPDEMWQFRPMTRRFSSLGSVRTLHLQAVSGDDSTGGRIFDYSGLRVFELLMLLDPTPLVENGFGQFAFFPLLRTLHLTSLDFDPFGDASYTLLDRLKEVLELRAIIKAGIEVLKLEKCRNISKEDIQSLRQIS